MNSNNIVSGLTAVLILAFIGLMGYGAVMGIYEAFKWLASFDLIIGALIFSGFICALFILNFIGGKINAYLDEN